MSARADTEQAFPSEPRVVRERLRALAGRMLVQAIGAVPGASQRGVAHFLGVSKALVARWADRGAPLDRVLGMPLEVRRALVRELAADAGLVAHEVADDTTTSDPRALAETLRATSTACTAYAEAQADGRITPDEAKAIVAVCDDAAEKIAKVRSRALGVLKSRGDAVRTGAA